MNRYFNTRIINGTYGTCRVERTIWVACRRGRLTYTKRVAVEGDRLDTLAAQAYGSGIYWWIIAAASGIGWAPQVPPGTLLIIPTTLAEVAELV